MYIRYKAHIWYEGTSYEYALADNKDEVIRGQGQILEKNHENYKHFPVISEVLKCQTSYFL